MVTVLSRIIWRELAVLVSFSNKGRNVHTYRAGKENYDIIHEVGRCSYSTEFLATVLKMHGNK